MYGARAYGTSSYGSISAQQLACVVLVSPITVQANILTPNKSITVFSDAVAVQANLLTPTTVLSERSVIVKVNGTDISNLISYSTLSVTKNLYSDPDTATFQIINGNNKPYTPKAGDVIEIFDTDKKIFGGVLIDSIKGMNGFVEVYTLDFKDWTEELSTILVAESYANETIEDIIADIFTNSNLSDYDATTNVSDTTTITTQSFDNLSVSACLDELADISGKRWYVSPNKEIFFFSQDEIIAPFNLTDTNENYDFSSLIYKEDCTQLRNKVIVKGEGVSAVTVEDVTSQSTYGLREYYTYDDSITATNEATQMANTILDAYKNPIIIITFETKKVGLYPGQQIQIDSAIRGITETINIESVQFIAETCNRFYYTVTCTTERLGGIEDLFQKVTEASETSTSTGDQSSLQSITFTVIDNETIQWNAGTVYTSGGNTYSVSARSSQTLTGDHVIYLDLDISETALQMSTNFADGLGNNKIPVAYALRNSVSTKGATIIPISAGVSFQLDGGTMITERSILTDNIAANAITANEVSINKLSAITADLGTITAGTVTGANIRTGASGRRIVMGGDQYLRWKNGDDTEGYIYNDGSGNMVIDADNSIYFKADGSGDYVYVSAGSDILLTSNNLIMTQSGNWQVNECDSFIVNFNSDNNGSGFYVNEDGDLAMSIDSGKNVWIEDNCSAKSFTDRTPYYDGKSALSDIKQIKGRRGADGKMGVDHDVLPDFIKKEVKHRNGDGEEFVQAERDLGNTISLLLEAIKELDARLDAIENANKKTEKKMY